MLAGNELKVLNNKQSLAAALGYLSHSRKVRPGPDSALEDEFHTHLNNTVEGKWNEKHMQRFQCIRKMLADTKFLVFFSIIMPNKWYYCNLWRIQKWFWWWIVSEQADGNFESAAF